MAREGEERKYWDKREASILIRAGIRDGRYAERGSGWAVSRNQASQKTGLAAVPPLSISFLSQRLSTDKPWNRDVPFGPGILFEAGSYYRHRTTRLCCPREP